MVSKETDADDLEQRRQTLYAALLRYAPEARSLRERVLDRIVLGALLGSTAESPLRVGAIQSNIRFGDETTTLRPDTINGALERLGDAGLVRQVRVKRRRSYYLTEDGLRDLDSAAHAADDLFGPVLQRLLENTGPLLDREIAVGIARDFISHCFARFGREIARVTTGEMTGDRITDVIDANTAFAAALSGRGISPEAESSMRARCFRFLRSNEPADEELKFRLTQGFYIAQLLELDRSGFNPIAQQSFEGTIFYVDTNVLLLHVLAMDESQMFDELVDLAARLGVKLRVTRATVDEARYVGASRREALETIVEKVPPELAELVGDQVVENYLLRRKSNPDLTPDKFLEVFDDIPISLASMGIELVELTTDEILGSQAFDRETAIISETALETRGWGKQGEALRHDVAHYCLVGREREGGEKVWFLTRDRTLAHASTKLTPCGLPFCFPLVAFLQSVSPFVKNQHEEQALFRVFSASLNHQIQGLPSETVFDLQEIKLIADLHEDVLNTPPDQLVEAFDYVRATALDGRRYRESDHTKMALGIRKFLASSVDEKHRALREETERLKQVSAEERSRRKAAENEASDLRATVRKAHALHAETQESLEVGRRRGLFLSSALLLLGAIVASGLWVFGDQVVGGVVTGSPSLQAYSLAASAFVRIAGSFLLGLASIPLMMLLRPHAQVAVFTLVLAVAVAGGELLSPASVSSWSGYLGLTAPLAVLITGFARRHWIGE